MNSRFRDALARGPILLDAAMGTRLIDRGLNLATDDPALWVIDHPLEILQIHQADIRAGSDALLTNTFGANRTWLGRLGHADETEIINRQAVKLARRAAGPDRLVIGSIGPTASDHPESLLEQVAILSEAGVDALLLETHQLDQACSALDQLREISLPILASLFHWPEPVEESARRLVDRGPSAIGANCLVGMTPALTLARRLRACTDLPLGMKPAAGLPGGVLESPEQFAEGLAELLACGVTLIGGCCGTTDRHLQALKARWPLADGTSES